MWSRDGSALFYRVGDALMSVPVTEDSVNPFGRPEELFSGSFRLDQTGHAGYDVMPDGQSFIMSEEIYGESLTEIRIILNWFDELERLAP